MLVTFKRNKGSQGVKRQEGKRYQGWWRGSGIWQMERVWKEWLKEKSTEPGEKVSVSD